MSQENSSIVFAHIGDLHLTTSKEKNYKDLLSIISDIEIGCASNADFVYLPGDNTDHGQVHSYTLLSVVLKMLSVPVYMISGDHDMEPGRLDNLYSVNNSYQMPFSVNFRGVDCLFLDVCGNGSGGPDFRIGEVQMKWLMGELKEAEAAQNTIIIFMHTFPEDLKDEGEKMALNKLIGSNKVVLVDMSHTHYNEIANDGNTIFTATRSTGQIEEGPFGYSLVSMDNNVASWRFKLLDEPFPYVMITYPEDHRLSTNYSSLNRLQQLRALVMGDRKIENVLYSIDDN